MKSFASACLGAFKIVKSVFCRLLIIRGRTNVHEYQFQHSFESRTERDGRWRNRTFLQNWLRIVRRHYFIPHRMVQNYTRYRKRLFHDAETKSIFNFTLSSFRPMGILIEIFEFRKTFKLTVFLNIIPSDISALETTYTYVSSNCYANSNCPLCLQQELLTQSFSDKSYVFVKSATNTRNKNSIRIRRHFVIY